MTPASVVLVFVFRWIDGLAGSIWASCVMASYVYVLQGEGYGIECVGFAVAVQGVVSVACTLPGWCTGPWSRDANLKFLAVTQLSAILVTSSAVMLNAEWSNEFRFRVLCTGLALWGMAQGTSPVVDSMFAGSVPVTTGSKLYARLHVGFITMQCTGPAIAAFVFFKVDNRWDLQVMQQVILLGMVIALIPTFTLLFFDDDEALQLQDADNHLHHAQNSPSRRGRKRRSRSHSPSRGQHAADQRAAGRGGAGQGLREPLLAGGRDVEEGLAQASDRSEPGDNGINDEQNLEGFSETFSLRSVDTRGSGQRSGDVSPAQSIDAPSAAEAMALAPAAAREQQPRASDNGAGATSTQVPLSPFLPTPELESALGNVMTLTSYPVDTTDALSDQSTGSGAASLSVKRTSGSHLIFPMTTLDEDSAVHDAGPVQTRASNSGSLHGRPGLRVMLSGEGGSQTGPPSVSTSPGSTEHRVGEASFRHLTAVKPDCPVHGTMRPGSAGSTDAAQCTCWQALGEAASSRNITNKLESFKLRRMGGPCVDVPSPSLLGRPAKADTGWAASRLGGKPWLSRFDSGISRTPQEGVAPVQPLTSPTDETGSSSNQQQQQQGEGQASGQGLVAPQPQTVDSPSHRQSGSPRTRGAPPPPPPQRPSNPDRVAFLRDTASQSSYRGSLDRSRPEHREPRGAKGLQRAASCDPACAGSESGHSSPDRAIPSNFASAGGVSSRRRARRLSKGPTWQPPDDNKGCCADIKCTYGVSWVPAIITITDFILGLASGMTIKFMPIFFIQEVGLTPAVLCLLYGFVPLIVSISSYAARFASQYIGRVMTLVINRAIGIGMLFVIATRTELWKNAYVIVPLAIGRSSLMNCNYAIERSIMADYTHKDHRAWWNKVEVVASFGWSGAAVLGGWLISKYGFEKIFSLTGGLQLVGWACSLLLLPIIPRRELSYEELMLVLAKLKTTTGPRGPRA